MRYSLLADIKGKALFAVFVFMSVFCVSSCNAYSYCDDSYPRARIIQDINGSSTYTFTANGSGFSTYEVQKNSGIVASGGFASGQTINGSFMSSSSSKEIVYFRIRNANGKVINGCETRVSMLKKSQRPACGSGVGQVFQNGEMGMSSGTVWGANSIYISGVFRLMSSGTVWGANSYVYFGGPSCYKGAPAILNYVSTSNRYGVIFSGPVTYNQSVYVAYNAPYFKHPADFDAFGCYDWLNFRYTNWVFNSGGGGESANEPLFNASFQIIPPAEGMIAGKNIQFNASATNIYKRVPDDYIWKLDGVDYRQGEDKSVIYANFPVAGTHTMSLTIREGRGNSGSSSQTFNVASPPAPPACNATFAAPASAYYDQNIIFDPTSSSNSGESDIVYKWSIDGNLAAISGFSLPIFNRSFGSSNGPDVDIKLDVEHSNGSRCSFARRVSLSAVPLPPPPPCTVDFDAKSGAESCLTGDCNYNEPIRFYVSASSGLITDYTWKMNKPSGVAEVFASSRITGPSVTSVSKTFYPADGKTHTVRLLAHDSNGNTCTMDKTINVQPSMPGWNEIAPYLMQLLGPIGFLGVVFLSRAIFLWL